MSYIISRPHGGMCGIGHQFHNWLSAWLLSDCYNLQFVYAPFLGKTTQLQINIPVEQWNKFLGFGVDELYESQLPDNIKRIQLPYIHWDESSWYDVVCEHPQWKNIILNHKDENVLFECQTNQFIGLGWQYLRSNLLRAKYKKKCQIYPLSSYFDKNKINVAIHIRRGDVNESGDFKVRWVSINVYINVIKQIQKIYGDKVIFHIYSDEDTSEFSVLTQFHNMILHLDENVFDTFHHMVMADILMPGQSSFSVLAGHLCENIKLARAWSPYWSHFPDNQKFITVEANGNFNIELLKKEVDENITKKHNS